MMRTQHIHGFTDGKLQVYDLICFQEDERSMVLNPISGTSLCISNDCLPELTSRTLSNDLAFVLVQRGLATHEDSRPISLHHDQINPTFFLIDLTKSCNLRCVYCFRELTNEAPKMSREQMEIICNSLIEYCCSHRVDHLCIQPWGGEPLLELSLIAMIRQKFRSANLFPQIVIETNATLITPEVARILKENEVEVGISIDGNALVHNEQRPFADGRPSLLHVENGISNLRGAGYENIFSITVVTKNTLNNLDNIISYFSQDLGLSSIKLNLMRKTERNRTLALDLEEIEVYVDRLLARMHKCYEQRIRIVEQNISQRLSNLLFRPCNNICNAHGCHGGYRMLSIDACGGVYPCELSDDPSYQLGQVGNGDFIDMIKNAISNELEYFSSREIEDCKACPWLFYCQGGCRAAVKYDCGDPRRIDITECTFNRVLYPRLVQIILYDPAFAHYLQNGEV